MANSFAALKAQDFAVVDPEGDLVGHLRVKPSNVAWRSAGQQKWQRIKLDRFIQLANEQGEESDN
ncbi:MAG TPA: hypothetical protein VGK90_03510 [Rhizomicrobium sp.]|jgi:hypothetical protein